MNYKIFVVIAAFAAITINTNAQFHDKKEGGGSPDPQLSQKDNDYLDRQATVFLDTIQSILSTCPPKPIKEETRERGFARLLMDAVFHEHFAAFRKPPQEFFHARVNQVIDELENSTVEEGARIWKLYNMGFIVRTASVTMAFDLASGYTSGSNEFGMNDEQRKRLSDQCDVLFMSHRHQDHAERAFAELFLNQDKPVVAPDEVWKDQPIHSRLTHLEPVPHKLHKLSLKNETIEVVAYPGHQGRNIQCTNALVHTHDGITVAHTGDQLNEGDFMIDYEWIDRVKDHFEVDIFMPSGWTMDMFRQVKGFDPKLVVPSHEIELGHTVWDRLPYWGDDAYLELNYQDVKDSKYPVVVMIWGESYHYIK